MVSYVFQVLSQYIFYISSKQENVRRDIGRRQVFIAKACLANDVI